MATSALHGLGLLLALISTPEAAGSVVVASLQHLGMRPGPDIDLQLWGEPCSATLSNVALHSTQQVQNEVRWKPCYAAEAAK